MTPVADAVRDLALNAAATSEALLQPLARMPQLLTPTEAARALRRSTRCLRRWEQMGLLRAVRPAGGLPLYPRAELEKLLSEGV